MTINFLGKRDKSQCRQRRKLRSVRDQFVIVKKGWRNNDAAEIVIEIHWNNKWVSERELSLSVENSSSEMEFYSTAEDSVTDDYIIAIKLQ